MSNVISDLTNSPFNTNCNTNSNSNNYLLACELYERSCLLRDKPNKIRHQDVDIMVDDDDPDLVDVDDVEDHVVVDVGGMDMDMVNLQNQYHLSQLNTYFNYGETLAKTGRLKETFDIYSHICNHMYYSNMDIPLDKLNCLVNAFIDKILKKRTNFNLSNFNSTKYDVIDPLYCPICEDILRYPVTAICGHTFCRQCCFGRTQCRICGQKFPKTQTAILSSLLFMNHPSLLSTTTTSAVAETATTSGIGADEPLIPPPMALTLSGLSGYRLEESTAASATLDDHQYHYHHPHPHPHHQQHQQQNHPTAPTTTISNSNNNNSNNQNQNFYTSDILDSVDNVNGFEQDILIRRLVEKWWSDEVKSLDFNEEAFRHLEINSLDAALRFCNQSLEYLPNSFNGLLLRSEILYRLNHYQSSLADADNALKNRPTSHKAHFRRALALSGLGRLEEALISQCISICLDRSAPGVSNTTRNHVAKLLQRIFSTIRPHSYSAPTTTSYSTPIYNSHEMKKQKRRMSRFNALKSTTTHNYKKRNYYEDENSSCGEEEFILSSSHQRRYMRRVSKNELLTSDNIIPKQNYKLRLLLDRIDQELEKVRNMEIKPTLLTVRPTLLDVSDFDCVLCCRTLWHPVVTPCGHTYCRVCLDRCMDYSSTCPLCMAPLIEQFRNHHNANTYIRNPTPLSLSKRKETKFLEAAMRRFIPEIYNKRKQQELSCASSVPIFICTTAFPSVPCPLFVYEPRYRIMVRRVIESGERQFGIALAQSGRKRFVEFGCMLDIRDCVQLRDGRSILSTVGARRFRVLERDEKDGYDTARIEYIDDEPISTDRLHLIRELHNKVLSKAYYWFENLPENIKIEILKSLGRMPDLENDWEIIKDGPAWSWWIIAILPLGPQLKVNILGTNNLEKRLLAIDKTLTLEYAAAQEKQRLLSGVVVDDDDEEDGERDVATGGDVTDDDVVGNVSEYCEECEGLASDCCQRTTLPNSNRNVNQNTPQLLQNRRHRNSNQNTEFMMQQHI